MKRYHMVALVRTRMGTRKFTSEWEERTIEATCPNSARTEFKKIVQEEFYWIDFQQAWVLAWIYSGGVLWYKEGQKAILDLL